MLYVCNYVKDNGFFKSAKRKPELKTVNNEGVITSETQYKRPSIPGGKRNYTPSVDYAKNRVKCWLKQDELNKLVKQMDLYDEGGNQITVAPLGNPSAPFWTHRECNLLLESASHTFNDELPIDKFWLECMKADPKFHFTNGDGYNHPVKSKVMYEVTPVNELQNDSQHAAQESEQALEKLDKMTAERRMKILKGMGVYVGAKQDPDLVRRTLFSKITFEKDELVRGSNQRNIDRFNQLAEASTTELTIEALFTDARKKQVIYKDKNGKFKYGEITLGNSETEAKAFLADFTKNEDIIVGITERVKDKSD